MAQTDKRREILVKRFNDYKTRFVDYIGKKEFEALCNLLGGEEKLISATYANMISSGYAYEGSLVRAALDIASYAFNINNTLPADERWEPRSLVKVCLLCQISKAQIFIPNTNNWEVNNRGILYSFNKSLKGEMDFGERSAYLALSAGVKLSPEEYEALISFNKDETKADTFYGSTLTLLLRTAINLANKHGKASFEKASR